MRIDLIHIYLSVEIRYSNRALHFLRHSFTPATASPTDVCGDTLDQLMAQDQKGN